MEPSVEKITSTRPVTTKTKARLGRKSLGEDTARSRVRTDRPRSTSADAGKRRTQSADLFGVRVSTGSSSIRNWKPDNMNKPLVGLMKAQQIKAASKGIRDKENGFREPMKVTVTKIKKDRPESLKQKVPSDSGVRRPPVKDKSFNSNAFCDLGTSSDDHNRPTHTSSKDKEHSTTALIVAGLQSKTQDRGRNECDPDVALWIKGLHLRDPEKYIKLFGEQEIDMESLRLINEKHLRAIGITAVGPVNKLMQGIRNLRGETFERYLEQFDSSRSQPLKVQGQGQDQNRGLMHLKNVNDDDKVSVKTKAKKKKGRIMSEKSETGSGEEENVAEKGDSLDMIPVKEPKKEKVVIKKNSFQCEY
jgi:hypothetical protein